MATTFDVIFLGTGPFIDPTEGNEISENASALVGNTYGGMGDSLVQHIQTMALGSTGYTGGMGSDGYDTNNSAINETFTIDGGAEQTFDGVAAYNATVSYIDGSSAPVVVVVFQDITGNLYLAPHLTNSTNQMTLEAAPMRSLTLDSVFTNDGVLGADRYDANYAVCFTAGTAIDTPQGPVMIDDLRVGDLVLTADNGPQRIRWIGRRHLDHTMLQAAPQLRPILIREGVLGAARDLLVSPQHGMLLGPDHLVRAKHLVTLPKSRVRIAHGKKSVTYIHLMFDAHQIVFAEGTLSESFYPGPMAQRMVNRAAHHELATLFPQICAPQATSRTVARVYGPTARRFLARKTLPLEGRHLNSRSAS